MTPSHAATALAVVTLAALLWWGERTGNTRARWALKPATSSLFLLVAILQGPSTVYDAWIVTGLLLSAVGDVALISRERPGFLGGLVAFLLGHVAYVAAFVARGTASMPDPSAAGLIAASGLGIFLYLRPHVGRMLVPVAAYMLVISVMLAAAWSVAAAEPDGIGRQLALAALLFYLSDITVARDRFVTGARFANRLVGLPLYYAAQFLFAFSVGA
jgi:uncharacterized membrane protein YhhN